MTFKLGLTGSIGMGKTTTAQMFAEEGVPVWDADEVVHRFYAKDGAAVEPIRQAYPEAIVDHAVSRDRLKEIIASDKSALSHIEDIVHPLVAQDREAFLRENEGKIVLFDIPLLFETGADSWLDAVVVVTAPPAVQRERVLARPGMTERQFQTVLERQIPDSEKRLRADHIIETTTLDAARNAVRDILSQIKESCDHA